MISIDEFIHAESSKDGRVFSQEVEGALRAKMHSKQAIIEVPDKCQFCKIEGVKENVDDNGMIIDKSPRGLVWLFPHEKWICNSCFKRMATNL